MHNHSTIYKQVTIEQKPKYAEHMHAMVCRALCNVTGGLSNISQEVLFDVLLLSHTLTIYKPLYEATISCSIGHIAHKIVFFSGHLPSSEVNSLWASSSLQGQCWAFPPARIFLLLQEISHSYSLPTCPLCVGERESERESSNSHEARKVKSVGEKIRDTVCEQRRTVERGKRSTCAITPSCI